LSREKLQVLAEGRIKEAEVLLRSQHWTGAYYLAGLGVECALKACLARAVQQYDFPDRRFINDAYTHKLEPLARLDPEVWSQLDNDMRSDEKLASNWITVFQWNDENRYTTVDELEAKSLYSAATEPTFGVMDWIRRRW
jgi:HEPN domain-containing protein